MIKFIFRWAFRFLILGIVLVVALLLLKDQIAKSIAETQIRRSTGMDVKIGALHLSLIRPAFDLENFVLYNTAEFGGGPFLDVPDLHLEYHPDARKGELRFKLVRLNIRELTIIENLGGQTNITSIAGALEKLQSTNTNRNDPVFKGIDTLNLTVGRVRYINMRIPKRNQDVNINLQNEIVQNVRTWDHMAGVLFKVLLRAGISIYFDQPAQPLRITNAPPRNPVPKSR